MDIDLERLAVIRLEPACEHEGAVPTSIAVGFLDGRTLSWHVRSERRTIDTGDLGTVSLMALAAQEGGGTIDEVAPAVAAALEDYTLVAEDWIAAAWRLGRLYSAGGRTPPRIDVASLGEVITAIGPADPAALRSRVTSALGIAVPFDLLPIEVARCVTLIRICALP